MRLIQQCVHPGCGQEPTWLVIRPNLTWRHACDDHIEGIRREGDVVQKLLDRIPDWRPGDPLYPDADLRDEERRRAAIADDLDGLATVGVP